jgi:hypothetical protein
MDELTRERLDELERLLKAAPLSLSATKELVAAVQDALPALLRLARRGLEAEEWSDPTPISHESLAALKLPCVPGRGFVVNDHFSIFKTRSRGWVLVAGNPSDDSLDSCEVASLTTLGQLRRLLSVLRGAK